MKNIWSLSVNQIHLISQLSEAKGIRDLARHNSVDPAAVSRLIRDAEELLGFSLVVRSQRGISLTGEGRQIVGICREVISTIGKFEEYRPSRPAREKALSFVLGSRGYLMSIIAGLVAQTPIEKSGCRFKFLDLSPSALLQACLSGLVDVAIHFEDWSWPASWATKTEGSLTWGLVVRGRHPIKPKVKLEQLQSYPFITASYLLEDRIERIPDAFPLRISQRWLGHESQTAFASKAILLNSDHVGFLPLISLEKEIMSSEIRVVKVLDMEPVQIPLRLSFHQERVLKKTEVALTEVLRKIASSDLELSKSLRS